MLRNCLQTLFGKNLSALGSNSNRTCTLLHQKMSSSGIVESSIKEKLESSLKPVHLEIINESYMHNVPPGSETHFKVVIVSDEFNNCPLIKRHRLVNEALKTELQQGVHALSILARTPKQWEESTQVIERSPACRGGFGK